MPLSPLSVEALYRPTDLSKLKFRTTRELEPVDTLVGQDRALEAVRFAARMRARGYNLFVIGPKGSGKHAAVRGYLQERAGSFPSADDWVYVTDFKDPHRPIALRLAPGQGPDLALRIDKLIGDLKTSVAAVLEGEDYRLRREEIDKGFAARGEAALKSVSEAAEAKELMLVRTPQGFAVAPADDGKPMNQETFNALPSEHRARLQQAIEVVQGLLRDALRHGPLIERDRQRAIRELNISVAKGLVDEELADVRADLALTPELDAWLIALHDDLIDRIHLFAQPPEGQKPGPAGPNGDPDTGADPQRRFRVNVFVANEPDVGAPVVLEDHPTLDRKSVV